MNRKILVLVSSWIFLAAIHTTTGFAKTPDCNVALETCKADCAKRPIYDRERGSNVTGTDFVSLCQNACQEASQWCEKQDSTNSCSTFAYHCESQCPWSVVDYTHQKLQHTDSFRQCENSCDYGAQACEPFRKSLPPRKRTGEFDVCPEAQTACYGNCVQQMKDLQQQNFSIADTDYPDKCAQACAEGVNDCQIMENAQSCDVYEQSCWFSCPSSITSSGVSKSDPQVQQWCRNSCSMGRAYCRSLQNLPFDRNTAPALVTAKPAPAAAPTVNSASPTKSVTPISTAAPSNQPKTITPTPHNVSACGKAELYCKDDCLKNKIINVMNGMWPQRYSNEAETDFWGQCEAACSRAKPGCLAGQGFKTPCQKECPKVYHDKSGNPYSENDGENRCQWSCTIGQDAYEGHENENICELGYDDCEGVCSDDSDMEGGDAFYQTCEAACKAGKTQCPNALPGNYCKDFYDSCTSQCPESSSDSDAGASCKEACGAGAHKCQERADLRYD